MSIISPEGRIRRSWYISTAPTSEPVTLSELKDYARIDTTSEDTVLAVFLQAAREGVEAYVNRSLMPRTMVLLADAWPEDGIMPLPRPPLISVTSIVEINDEGTETTYDSDDYIAVTGVQPGYIQLKVGSTAPPLDSPRLRHPLKITYQAGYADAASVPGTLKVGLMALATAIYENRVANAMEPPPEAKMLLDSYRIRPIGTSIGR